MPIPQDSVKIILLSLLLIVSSLIVQNCSMLVQSLKLWAHLCSSSIHFSLHPLFGFNIIGQHVLFVALTELLSAESGLSSSITTFIIHHTSWIFSSRILQGELWPQLVSTFFFPITEEEHRAACNFCPVTLWTSHSTCKI